MAKDNKKKSKKAGKGGVSASATKVTKRLRELTRNPLIADFVAATLVGAAAALKDSKKAHQLAASAEKELQELGRSGAARGSALWQLALDVGHKSLAALGSEAKPAKRQMAKAKPAKSKAVKAKPAKAKSAVKRKPARPATATSRKPVKAKRAEASRPKK